MILKNGSFEQMALRIKQKDKRIVIFGAGMIGTVTTPTILREYGIEDRVSFYVDNDRDKCNEGIVAYEKAYDVFRVEHLESVDGRNIVVLLAVSRFSDALSQLNKFPNLKNAMCYIVPMMCISNFTPSKEKMVVKDSSEKLIPKVIHYMWLGEGGIPKPLQRCIDSWKRYCPDYEIRQWDETNYDVGKNLYMRQAYARKMFGFVPDYARLDILYTYGGIYLDTDVELVKNLDDMLYQEAFCCVEKWQTINLGGGSGSVKGNKAIGILLKAREYLEFEDSRGKMNKNTCGYYYTIIMQKYGFKIQGKKQKILNMNIYPYEVFHPYDYMSGKLEQTENTYGIHHFHGGWLDERMKEENRRTSEEYERVYVEANKGDAQYVI